jgi:hypothetical protein
MRSYQQDSPPDKAILHDDQQEGVADRGSHSPLPVRSATSLTFLGACLFVGLGLGGVFMYSGLSKSSSTIADNFSNTMLSEDGSAQDDGQWDLYEYTTYSTKNTPLGVYTSLTGEVAIASDEEGHVYRSTDYGATWTSSKAIYVESEDTYASIYGLVMTTTGKKMIAGTGEYLAMERMCTSAYIMNSYLYKYTCTCTSTHTCTREILRSIQYWHVPCDRWTTYDKSDCVFCNSK